MRAQSHFIHRFYHGSWGSITYRPTLAIVEKLSGTNVHPMCSTIGPSFYGNLSATEFYFYFYFDLVLFFWLRFLQALTGKDCREMIQYMPR
jgi:hypothetical protein